MATSNFLVHDSDKNNIQNDGDFLASATRTGGFVAGVAPSVYFNKLLYQLSTMIAALGQAMANKGYTVADTTLATLTTALENIMTLADMTDYPTNTEMVAYVASQIPVIDFTNLKTTNGYQKLPGGLILQWGKYNSAIGTDEPIISVSFPITFTTACLHAQATGYATNNLKDSWPQISSFSSSTLSIQIQHSSSGNFGLDGFYWFAIGY
jgi:hypothetical protein